MSWSFDKCPLCGKLRIAGSVCAKEGEKDHGKNHDTSEGK